MNQYVKTRQIPSPKASRCSLARNEIRKYLGKLLRTSMRTVEEQSESETVIIETFPEQTLRYGAPTFANFVQQQPIT